MNKVMLIGKVPQVCGTSQYGPDADVPVCEFPVSTGGDGEECYTHTVVASGELARKLTQHLRGGMSVYVEGTLRHNLPGLLVSPKESWVAATHVHFMSRDTPVRKTTKAANGG